MKKKLYFITTLLLATAGLSLSSCLKDSSHYIDFGNATPVVEFNLGGLAYFGSDNIQSPNSIDTIQFAVSVTTKNVPTTATTVNLAVDNSIITSYVATNPAIQYQPLPTADYTISTLKVVIPANQRVAIVTLYVNMTLIDPSQSYMLPIKITGSSPAYTISGNMGIHYFHFIGNPFAGNYEHYYTRWNTPDTTTTPSTPRTDEGVDIASPISPTEFTIITDYYTQPRYDITFTQTGTGPSAMYSNFQVTFYASDVAAGGQWASNITVVTAPKFVPNQIAFSSTQQYTYAQALKLFRVYFNTSSRGIIDQYIHK
jgi:hypothetical protein